MVVALLAWWYKLSLDTGVTYEYERRDLSIRAVLNCHVWCLFCAVWPDLCRVTWWCRVTWYVPFYLSCLRIGPSEAIPTLSSLTVPCEEATVPCEQPTVPCEQPDQHSHHSTESWHDHTNPSRPSSLPYIIILDQQDQDQPSRNISLDPIELNGDTFRIFLAYLSIFEHIWPYSCTGESGSWTMTCSWKLIN